jgi:hypothetical protein
MTEPKEIEGSLQDARLLYPRVSDIIGKQTYKEMQSIPIEVLANAQIRGTKVHEYCTGYVQGLWLPEIEEEYQPYFESFVKWYTENVQETLFICTRLYDDVKRFSGEFDMIVILKDSKEKALIDIKTSANVSKSWPIQLAAYKHLCGINDYHIESVYNIHLKKTKPGVVKPVSIKHADLTAAWGIFSSALDCFDYFDRKELKICT